MFNPLSARINPGCIPRLLHKRKMCTYGLMLNANMTPFSDKIENICRELVNILWHGHVLVLKAITKAKMMASCS